MKALQFIGVDKAILYSVSTKIWSISGGALSLYLIVRELSGIEQGFFFTFGGLLALKVLFEFGFSQVVLRFSSYEMGNVDWNRDDCLTGDPASIQRLASLLHKIVRWYAVTSILFALIMIPAGILFFLNTEDGFKSSYWLIPWILVVTVTSLNLMIAPILGFLQGCGHIELIENTRLLMSIAISVLLWISLISGADLYSLAIAEIGGIMIAILLIYRRHINGLFLIWHSKSSNNFIDWKRDIWPFQWRVATSWLFGYFCAKAFIPIVFTYLGAEEAGRLGLSLSIMDHVAGISSAWLTTRMPRFGVLVNQQQWNKLDRLFKVTLFQSLGVLCLSGLVLWVAIFIMNYYQFSYSDRLLGVYGISILILIRVVMLFSISMANYVHAHKKQPFFYIAIANGLLSITFAVICAKWYGIDEILLSRLAISIIIVFITYFIFNKKQAEWHI